MKTFYYIGYRKRRFGNKYYVGDGIWTAPNKTVARTEIAYSRRFPRNLIVLKNYIPSK